MNLRSLRKKLGPRGWDLQARRRWRDLMLGRFGMERSYKPLSLIKRPDWSLGSLLKFVVAHELAARRDFTFLQIGAYDGVGDDDLRELIFRYRLRGVLVEPQPAAFERLRQTYANQPQVTLLNVAIAEMETTRALYCPRTGDAMVASFDRGHLLRHGIPSADIVAQSVPCHTVAGAMRLAGVDQIDLLQTDAEGYDYQILKAVDFATVSPAIVRFEYRHMSRAQVDECISSLAGHGYRFLLEEKDIIAHRPRPQAAVAAA